MNPCPNVETIRKAARRIAPYVHRTPVLTCDGLDGLFGVKLYFKCENFQKAGAFKSRGACNAVFQLPDGEARHGVVTHSSGNHAAAPALAARKRGIEAYIVMPHNASAVKKAAVSGYGGRITYCEPTLAAREAATTKIREQTGAAFIHPFNDYRVIAGRGTAALELPEEAPDLDHIMTPVGGGSLLSGSLLVASELCPRIAVIAGEPHGVDDAYRSLQEDQIIPSVSPNTIADGLLTSLGDLTFPMIKRHVRQIVLVSEEAIMAAMRYVWERMKIIIEPSSAVPVGILLEKKVDLSGRRIGIILTGGNVFLHRLPWMHAGR